MSTRFVEPAKKKVVHELSESLRRKRDACSRIHHSYIWNKTTDKNEIETSILAQKYPELTHDVLLTCSRVLLKKGQFEVDAEKDIMDDKVKEALVYSVRREVRDPLNPNTVVLRHCTIKYGVYQKPYAAITKNDSGEVVSSDIIYWQNTFYIPWSEKTAREVLAEYDYQYRNLVCAYAITRGDSWNDGKTFEIKNLEEWLTIPIETLVQANKAGTLSSEYGGHIVYLKAQAEKRARMEAEIAEYNTSNIKGGKVKK